MGSIAKWFITSKIGIALLLAAAMLTAAGVTHHVISKNAYNRGVSDTVAKYLAERAIANQRQAIENERKNKLASAIANKADADGQKATTDTDIKTNQTKEVIRYVYHDAPRTQPVAAGSPVHPLDQRVQARIDQAVDQANDP